MGINVPTGYTTVKQHISKDENSLYLLDGKLLDGKKAHISSVECWCKPYQDDQCPNVWVHHETLIGRA